MKINKIDNLFIQLSSNRQTGYTTMMLRAAMYNPDCIIISKDMRTAKYNELRYEELYETTFNPKNRVKRLYIKSLIWVHLLNKPTTKPNFLYLSSNIYGYNKPILLDNSCFMI